MKTLVADAKKCIGCRVCEQWCSMVHHGAVNPAKSRIRVTRLEDKGVDVPTICMQCTKPACVSSCPTDALEKNPKTGAVKTDKEKCTGCRLCMEACPHGAVGMHPTEGYVLICDLCHGKPKCVENCPESALTCIDAKSVDSFYRAKALKAKEKGGAAGE
ncbi:Fe-S-cluster-containing hydrogenase component 2 [Desulfitispora alkaliphila]|uniref:4Fe-4S dicluster domain-containing protein n=1 Tax=Desulfitispora alkaliphila TaxID=622674 RepID=UPI003D1C4EF5